MNKIKVSFDTLVQLLGMLGVLGGLVFVGLEMQQSQRIAIAGQIQARNQGDMDFAIALLTAEDSLSREVNEMGALFTIDPASLTEEQVAARNLIIRWQITSLQNAWQQYELGLLPQDVWQQVENRIRSRWESCYTRDTFTNSIPSFRQFLETIPVEDCD